jgi:hypothetical protein
MVKCSAFFGQLTAIVMAAGTMTDDGVAFCLLARQIKRSTATQNQMFYQCNPMKMIGASCRTLINSILLPFTVHKTPKVITGFSAPGWTPLD